jgi:putative endonuclease
MEKLPCVYILAKASHSTLYTGVTSDLAGRIWQHREGVVRGFTQRYGIKRLLWFEAHETMESAILREKRVKRWPRAWKYDLIHERNPTWRDLAEDLGFPPLPLKCWRVPANGRDDGYGPRTFAFRFYRISDSSTPFVSRASSALTPLIAQAMAT